MKLVKIKVGLNMRFTYNVIDMKWGNMKVFRYREGLSRIIREIEVRLVMSSLVIDKYIEFVNA